MQQATAQRVNITLNNMIDQILIFEPIYKSVLWGGTRIAQFKGVASQGDHVGESWELSGVSGSESVVSSGVLRGCSLSRVLDLYGADIMGERLWRSFGNRFPLLVKFIDSNSDLSVQVHPDESLASERHNSPGKTEMWYSLAPLPGSYLYAGFSEFVDRESFVEAVKNESVVPLLRKHYTSPGDVFYLPAGMVHSLGPGNLILEIQQSSDITYRIYDYGRVDKDGAPRRLHVAESLDAVKYGEIAPEQTLNVQAEAGRGNVLADSQWFTSALYGVEGCIELDVKAFDSFVIVVAVEGSLEFEAPGGVVTLSRGNTALIPACLDRVKVGGHGAFIAAYIN